MSKHSAMDFLLAVRDSAAMLARYDRRNLTQLVFHARNEGYGFTADELGALVSALEASVILDKDHDPFDGTSELWRTMWGRPHLSYLIEHVVGRHTDVELWRLVDGAQVPA